MRINRYGFATLYQPALQGCFPLQPPLAFSFPGAPTSDKSLKL